MKRLIPILLAVFAFAACEKDPDMDKLDNDYLVYTNYDKKADFKQFSTYYIPDSVLVIGDKKDPEYWKGEAAAAIINAYKDNLNSKGFPLPTTDNPNGGGTIPAIGMHLTGVTGAVGTIRML